MRKHIARNLTSIRSGTPNTNRPKNLLHLTRIALLAIIIKIESERAIRGPRTHSSIVVALAWVDFTPAGWNTIRIECVLPLVSAPAQRCERTHAAAQWRLTCSLSLPQPPFENREPPRLPFSALVSQLAISQSVRCAKAANDEEWEGADLSIIAMKLCLQDSVVMVRLPDSGRMLICALMRPISTTVPFSKHFLFSAA